MSESGNAAETLRELARLIDDGHYCVDSINMGTEEDVVFLAEDIDTRVLGFELELSVSRVRGCGGDYDE